MILQTWGIYVSAVVLLCLTPGPNSLLAITNGLRYGVARTVFSTLGCVAGLTLLIGLSVTGLGLVLAASATAFTIIKWLGAAYLVYLGVTLMLSRGSLLDAASAAGGATTRSRTALFSQGLLIVAMNPKALIFFAAFLPQFYSAELPFWSQFAVLAGTFVAVEFAIEMALAASASRLAGYARSGGNLRPITRATGGAFVVAGAWLLTAERPR